MFGYIILGGMLLLGAIGLLLYDMRLGHYKTIAEKRRIKRIIKKLKKQDDASPLLSDGDMYIPSA